MKNEEHHIQKAAITWARMQACTVPELDLLHAIPNGGARSKATAGKLKAEGVLAGVCDLFLPVARGPYHGLYIEVKTETGRLTKAQGDFLVRVRGQGYQALLCRSFDSIRNGITSYLNL